MTHTIQIPFQQVGPTPFSTDDCHLKYDLHAWRDTIEMQKSENFYAKRKNKK